VFTIFTLTSAVNGLLTWIGRGFGIHHLTMQLVLGYVFYPVTFFMGVPRDEILPVAQLLARKLVVNEFVGFTNLKAIMEGPHPLSIRAHTIAAYSLCGFAGLSSLGIQLGILSALAPSRRKIIARIGFSALLCGFFSTMQTAAIAGMLL
jgi:CNT family concentrative nucleoside transporter